MVGGRRVEERSGAGGGKALGRMTGRKNGWKLQQKETDANAACLTNQILHRRDVS